MATQSSSVTPSMGMNGITSAAPSRGMRARVLGQVDQLGSFADAADRRLGDVDRIADQGNDAAVVIGIHLAVEEIDAVHLHGFKDGVDASLVAPFREVRNTFDECGHKDQDKAERAIRRNDITGGQGMLQGRTVRGHIKIAHSTVSRTSKGESQYTYFQRTGNSCPAADEDMFTPAI